ncbi:alveolin domain containing intermediate filament IMC7 [Cardiosporidium cionae]|uniref:Alveolin domain containing intermediate filament IMC7 n=1 Tax=Cardiosporidium cionae TaxID=476202 RepID=A0ABQ7JBR5_9APIC|nr:alveolin domain containing intermediate filament IMC7 [Cardiosporidium cionae]|eukprot:KAF8821437.1 alveolin domain containing intermediate filament IMC7 [Cardiosporidium cionae]
MLFRGSGGHRQYFQQGFYPPMDSSGHILPPTKLVSGISREQMSSLPVQFYDVHFNSGVAYNTVPGADAQSAFPAPIPVPITGYGQEYAQRNEFHPTRITDRIQDTVIPECGAPQIFSPELPYYSATHQYESATPPSYDPRNNLYGSQHVAPLPAEPDVPHSFPDKYTRTVPKIEVVEVPVEVIRYVPKIETKIVEQVVEVPGPEKIPVPRPYFVDVQVVEPKYEDRDIPLIVSQNVVPEIQEVSDVIEIEVFKYEPEVTYVDVYVPRPVAIPIKATGVVEQKEIPSQGISEEQLRIAMDEINPHLHDVENYNNAQAGTFESLVQQSESTARIHGLEAPDPIRRPMYSLEDERKTEEVAPEEAEAVATIDNVETDTTDVQ